MNSASFPAESLSARAARNFFTHSGHVPLVLLILEALLAASKLSAGAGVHYGQVVEGVLGGEGAKAFDFIGDTVNTAQRVCDAAAPGELLVSITACGAAGLTPARQRDIVAKGKRELLRVAVVA